MTPDSDPRIAYDSMEDHADMGDVVQFPGSHQDPGETPIRMPQADTGSPQVVTGSVAPAEPAAGAVVARRPRITRAHVITAGQTVATGYRWTRRAAKHPVTRATVRRTGKTLGWGVIIATGPLAGLHFAYETVQNWRQVAELREGGTHRGMVHLQHHTRQHAEQARRERQLASVVKGARWPAVGVAAVEAYAWLATGPIAHDIATGTVVAGIGAGVALWGMGVTHVTRKLGVWRKDALVDLAAEQVADGNIGADYLTAALRDAGVLAAPTTANPDGEAVRLAEPVRFDEYGWAARIVLPSTKSAGQVTNRHERLVAALGSTLKKQQVKVQVETPSIVRIRVYNQLPYTGTPVPHPLIGTGAGHSVIRNGIPAGLDINGDRVTINVADDLHGLIVAASGMGKTVHVRNVALTVAHSCDAEIGGIFDGKASGDYDVVRDVCGTYIDTMESGANWWILVAKWLEREVAIAMDRQQRRRRGETLNLRFVILDEFQMAFGYPSDRTKKSPAERVLQAVEELSRLGRSAGMRVILASQSFDGNVLPKGIAANFLWRLVGYVSSEWMDPKDSVGEQGLSYGLIPDQEFTPAQKGAAITLSTSLPDGYAVCRGWYQDDDVITEDIRTVLADRPATEQAAPSTPVLDLGEDDQALLEACAEVYAEDDSEWISTKAIAAEVAVGELGWTAGIDNRAAETAVGEALRRAGLDPVRKTIQGSKLTVVPREALVTVLEQTA